MSQWLLRQMLNLYPPYLGTGISVQYISPDFKRIRVRMKLRWYNRNYVKTHFGGSLYAMTDPFLMLMLIRILGKEYVVWDKSAQIEFIKPGVNTVSVEFVVTDSDLDDIYKNTESGEKYFHNFRLLILDEGKETVAEVKKRLYIRKKRKVL